MNDTTKTTTKTSKVKATVAPKVQDAAPDATDMTQAKREHKFDSPDDLAHFIHHNPEFGTLPLDEQDALRAQLIDLKRAQAQA